MSIVKSFRLSEYEENLLDQCTMRGFTNHQTIVNALEYYLENVVCKDSGFDMVINFDQMPEGVNNPLVDTFIKQVVGNTNFKFGMYLDGDCVGFKVEENIYMIDKE